MLVKILDILQRSKIYQFLSGTLAVRDGDESASASNLMKWQGILEIILLGLGVSIVLAHTNPLYSLPGRDGSFFLYTGNQLLKGKLLYVDIWDHKAPLIFYINAFSLWIGHGSLWGLWLVEYLFLFFSAITGFSFMKKLWGPTPALFGTLVWLFTLNIIFELKGGNFTEEFSLLFNFLAIFIFWKSNLNKKNSFYPLIIGITLGLSFLLRANNIGVQLSIISVMVLSCVLDKDYRLVLKQLFLISIGVLSIFALVALYFQSLGTLEEMFNASITYNYYYSEGGTGMAYFGSHIRNGVILFGEPFILIMVFAYILLFRKIRQDDSSGEVAARNIGLLFLIGFPVEALLSSLSGRGYIHYYTFWTPYFGFLSGMLVSLIERIKVNYLIIWSLMFVLITSTNLDLLGEYRVAFSKILFERSDGIELEDDWVVKYVRNKTKPDDKVLIWGIQPKINFLSDREAPSSINIYPLIAESPFTNVLNERFYTELVENKPTLIVDMAEKTEIPFIDPTRRKDTDNLRKSFTPPHNIEQVFDFILSNYHIEKKVKDVTIYRINENVP